MTHEYKLYANNECVETVTFDDEARTFMTDNLQSKTIDIRSTHMNRQAKKSEVKLSQDKAPKNCPNCGAPRTGHTCEYCGTILDPEEAKKEKEYFDHVVKEKELELERLKKDLQWAQTCAAIDQMNSSLFTSQGRIQLLSPAYGLQGARWSDSMAQQVSPSEFEQWNKKQLLSSTNVYPYYGTKTATNKKQPKRILKDIFKNLWKG